MYLGGWKHCKKARLLVSVNKRKSDRSTAQLENLRRIHLCRCFILNGKGGGVSNML